MKKKFSFFKSPITNVMPYKDVTTEEMYDYIKSNKFNALITKELRSSPANGKEIKAKKFPYVLFSGVFSKRGEAHLIAHSDLICIDLDHLPDVEEAKLKILTGYLPELMFVSPSGDGLKVIYHIDIKQGAHIVYFKAIQEYLSRNFDLKIDPSGKDVSRACFLPSDPECYYNGNPAILDAAFIKMFPEVKAPEPVSNESVLEPQDRVFGNKIDIAVNMIRQSADGEKHSILLSASRLMGGYIASGEVDEELAIEALEDAIRKKNNVNSFSDAQNTIRKGIEHGKKTPLVSDPLDGKIPFLPIEGLPEKLQFIITECNRVYGTHRDFWAGSILSALALAIGQSHELNWKYTNGAVMWTALVAPSGVGKSEPLSFAFEPFHKKDMQEIEIYGLLLVEYEEAMKMTAAQRKEEGIEEKPQKPICHQYLLTDTTPEAVIQANKNNERGIAVVRDEIHGWILDIGRYSKSGELTNALSSWSQKTMTVNRKVGVPLKIEKPFVNYVGGLQPDILPELAKDNRDVNGFMQRFVFIFPNNVKRPKFQNMELPEAVKKQYNELINTLLSLTEFCEPVLLSEEAKNIYERFVNRNSALINSEKIDYLIALHSKFDIISLRFALIIHVTKIGCTGIKEKHIAPETMKTAIDISEYFRATGLKVYRYLKTEKSEIKFGNKEVANYLQGLGNSQNKIAEVLKISQPAVNKLLKIKPVIG